MLHLSHHNNDGDATKYKMKLQTTIPLEAERDQIDYGSKILLMGSCFVESMGAKLAYYQFQHLQNPFGIVFHPIAIEKLVTRAINEDHFVDTDIFFHSERWHCFEVHSELSTTSKEEFLETLNGALNSLNEYIRTASHIIFTYGTAWVYRFIETDSIVANCHKIPQNKFLKELLSVEAVAASIENTNVLIKTVNPHVKCIHTVSPVRHLKDGSVENMRSKAHLIAGLQSQISRKDAMFYFPAYEIVMDELRDYRFYKEDLIHPNATAISIMWEKFKQVWISSETDSLQKEIETVQTGLHHKPFDPKSEAHKAFQKNLQEKIELLKQKISHLDL